MLIFGFRSINRNCRVKLWMLYRIRISTSLRRGLHGELPYKFMKSKGYEVLTPVSPVSYYRVIAKTQVRVRLV